MGEEKLEMLKLGVRKSILTVRSVKHWKGFPREIVQCLFFEVFKTRLDKAQSNLV